MSKKQTSYYLEIFWLFIAVVCLVVAVIFHIKTDFSQAKLIYICSGIGFLMYFSRRYIRLKNKKKHQ